MLRRATIVGVAALWWISLAAAQSVVWLEPYAGKLKHVRVTVAGAERQFLFDTGGGYTLVTPQLARLIGCTPSGRIAGFRMTGARFDTATCASVRLTIGSLPSRVEAVGVFDLMALLPKELPALEGVISLASFRAQRVTLDLAGGRMIVGAESNGVPFPCRAATGLDGSNYVLFASVERSGSAYWFEIDSGNLDSVLVAPHAAPQFGLDPTTKEATETDLALGQSASARVSVRVANILYDGVLSAQFLEGGTLSANLSDAPTCRWQPRAQRSATGVEQP
ncbi:MAG: aspartyl protease family protein [Alphaproteobacteria bacterium]|nr:aspartyl protease family protein [Alphaproteobacteria bacterium]